MIVDRFTNEILTSSVGMNIPDPGKGVVETKEVEGIEIRFIRNAEPMGFNSVVLVPYSLSALRNGKYIAAASIERMDLRELSHMTGTSIKTLQEEYGVRGFLLDPTVVLYGEGGSENLGRFQLSFDEETVKAYLYETILDMLDISDE